MLVVWFGCIIANARELMMFNTDDTLGTTSTTMCRWVEQQPPQQGLQWTNGQRFESRNATWNVCRQKFMAFHVINEYGESLS